MLCLYFIILFDWASGPLELPPFFLSPFCRTMAPNTGPKANCHCNDPSKAFPPCKAPRQICSSGLVPALAHFHVRTLCMVSPVAKQRGSFLPLTQVATPSSLPSEPTCMALHLQQRRNSQPTCCPRFPSSHNRATSTVPSTSAMPGPCCMQSTAAAIFAQQATDQRICSLAPSPCGQRPADQPRSHSTITYKLHHLPASSNQLTV